MSTFIKRLKFYGIGFGIGLIFVFFFFQNRGCSWLPSNRVKNAILDRLIVVSDSTDKVMKARNITMDDIVLALNDGEVYFKESDKDNASKVYIIEKDDIKYAFTLPYESFISEVQIRDKNAVIKGTSKGEGKIIHYPMDDNLVFPDTTKLVTCQQEALGLIEPKKILKLIKSTGKIDFEKTNLNVQPKPEHYIHFTKNGQEIGTKMIWYKNKLNIISFYAPKADSCQ